MKLTVATKDLSDALKRVQACVKKVDTILGHVLLEATVDGGLTISGTDLIREVKLRVAANVSVPGSRTAHAQLLTGFAGYAPGEIVQIVLHEGKLHVKSGSARASVPSLAPEAYYSAISAQSEGEHFKLSPLFLAAWNNISFCTNGVTKPFLGGVYVYPSERSWVSVSSTGIALMETKLDAPESTAALPPIIIPKESVQLASALFPDGCDLSVSKNTVTFSNEDATMATLLLEGPWFEAYVKQIEPGNHTVKVDRKRFLKGINFVKRTEDKFTISCSESSLKLHSGRGDGARAADELTCDGSLPFDIVIQAEYFAPIIEALHGDILTMNFTDNVKPIIMSSESLGTIGVAWPRRF